MELSVPEAVIKFRQGTGRLIRRSDDKGVVTSDSIDMGGQVMDSPFTDYQFDDHGNWTSRKTSMMGQDMVTTRTFEYYE